MKRKRRYYDEHTMLFLNGKWKKASEGGLDLFSQTLHYGTGVFEGLRAYETPLGPQIFKPEEHFDRLHRSAKLFNIDIEYTIEELVEISYALLKKNNFKNAYIRPLVFMGANMSLTLTDEVHVLISAWDWPPLLGNDLLKVMISSYTKPNPKAMPVDAKISGQYINSILATNEAKSKGFDEALLLDMDGYIAQGPGANFFLEKNNRLITPPEGNIMPGITRETIIELSKELGYKVEERNIKPEEVVGADAAFFTGTASEVAGIRSIGGHTFDTPWEDTIAYSIFLMYRNRVTHKEYRDFHLV